MNPIHRLLVVAALVAPIWGAAPALADLVVPPVPAKDAPPKAPAPDADAPDADAPDADEAEPAVPAREGSAALKDGPIDEPRPRVPPPIDEELMKTLPPPSIGIGEMVGPLLKTMFMLCVVLGLVYLTLHKGLGKLIERQNLGKRVKVVERVNLDQRRALFVVEIDGKQMLLAAGEGGVVHLKDLDAAAQDTRAPSASSSPGSGSGLGARFAEALKSRIPGGQPPVTTGLSRVEDPVSKAGGAS